MQPAVTIDVSFDFREDTPPARDPDSCSPTLRGYHRFLWSNDLPSGAAFELDDRTPRAYLQPLNHSSSAASADQETRVQDDTAWTAVTFENCHSVAGPFYHGTAAELEVGDLLMPGFASNYQEGRISNHVYFSATVASLAAQMAAALTGAQGRGHVYIVEPTGPFEDDPNVTNKRFRGNPTKSYRSRHPLRITGKVDDWEEHGPEVINAMLDGLAALRKRGLDVIED